MALAQSKQVVKGFPVPAPVDSVGLVPIVAEYVVPAAGNPIGDVIEMAAIPNNCVPVDGVVHFGAGTAGSTLAWGLLSGSYGTKDNGRACGSEFAAAFSVAASGIQRFGKGYVAATQPDDTKGWGFVVAGAALQAGQVIRGVLYVAPAPIGIS